MEKGNCVILRGGFGGPKTRWPLSRYRRSNSLIWKMYRNMNYPKLSLNPVLLEVLEPKALSCLSV